MFEVRTVTPPLFFSHLQRVELLLDPAVGHRLGHDVEPRREVVHGAAVVLAGPQVGPVGEVGHGDGDVGLAGGEVGEVDVKLGEAPFAPISDPLRGR